MPSQAPIAAAIALAAGMAWYHLLNKEAKPLGARCRICHVGKPLYSCRCGLEVCFECMRDYHYLECPSNRAVPSHAASSSATSPLQSAPQPLPARAAAVVDTGPDTSASSTSTLATRENIENNVQAAAIKRPAPTALAGGDRLAALRARIRAKEASKENTL